MSQNDDSLVRGPCMPRSLFTDDKIRHPPFRQDLVRPFFCLFSPAVIGQCEVEWVSSVALSASNLDELLVATTNISSFDPSRLSCSN